MTTDTGCDIYVPIFQARPVDARIIFLHLVDTERRVKFLHQRGVAVAFAAKSRDLLSGRFCDIAPIRVLGTSLVVLVRIAAVTVTARKPFGLVDVVVKKVNRIGEALFELAVTFDTRRRSLLGRGRPRSNKSRRTRNDHNRQERQFEVNEP